MFVPFDPGAPDDMARRGEVVFDYGQFWFRGQAMGTDQCPVKAYNRYFRDLIHTGKASPSFVVSHQLPLAHAPEGYQHFDARDQGWTKVALSPPNLGGPTRAGRTAARSGGDTWLTTSRACG